MAFNGLIAPLWPLGALWNLIEPLRPYMAVSHLFKRALARAASPKSRQAESKRRLVAKLASRDQAKASHGNVEEEVRRVEDRLAQQASEHEAVQKFLIVTGKKSEAEARQAQAMAAEDRELLLEVEQEATQHCAMLLVEETAARKAEDRAESRFREAREESEALAAALDMARAAELHQEELGIALEEAVAGRRHEALVAGGLSEELLTVEAKLRDSEVHMQHAELAIAQQREAQQSERQKSLEVGRLAEELVEARTELAVVKPLLQEVEARFLEALAVQRAEAQEHTAGAWHQLEVQAQRTGQLLGTMAAQKQELRMQESVWAGRAEGLQHHLESQHLPQGQGQYRVAARAEAHHIATPESDRWSWFGGAEAHQQPEWPAIPAFPEAVMQVEGDKAPEDEPVTQVKCPVCGQEAKHCMHSDCPVWSRSAEDIAR